MGINPFTGKIEQATPPLRFNPLAGAFQFSGGTNRVVFDPVSGGFEFAKTSGPAPFVGPLDSVQAGCILAYASGQRLFGSSNPSWTLRRSSDNAEQIFQADPSTGAFGADVLAFISGTDAFYVNGQEQINGFTLSQATAGSQPTAAVAGTLVTQGSGFAMTSVNKSLSSSSTGLSSLTQPFTIFIRLLVNGRANNTGPLRFGSSATGVGFNGTNWTSSANGGAAVNTFAPATLATLQTVRLIINGAASSLAINAGVPTVYNVGTSANCPIDTIDIGRSTVFLNGSIAFVGVWSGAKIDGAIEAALDTIW